MAGPARAQRVAMSAAELLARRRRGQCDLKRTSPRMRSHLARLALPRKWRRFPAERGGSQFPRLGAAAIVSLTGGNFSGDPSAQIVTGGQFRSLALRPNFATDSADFGDVGQFWAISTDFGTISTNFGALATNDVRFRPI